MAAARWYDCNTMSKATRHERVERARLRAAGLDDSDLPADARRELRRTLSKVELLDDIRRDIASWSAKSVMEYLTAEARDIPPFLIARVVREVSGTSGTTAPTPKQIQQLAHRLLNAFDPALARRLGGDFSEVAIGRLIASQLLTQREFTFDLVPAAHILFDPTTASPIGPGAWEQLLGVDFRQFVLLVRPLAHSLSRSPVNLRRYLDGTPRSVATATHNIVELLIGNVDELRAAATARTPVDPSDEIYDHGPLLQLPLYSRADGRIATASPEYLMLATSPPGLYIRLIQADHADGTRARSQAVGDRFGTYLHRYARGGLPSDWIVRKVDDEPPPYDGTKIADLAIWPSDRSWLLIIEGKATLQHEHAQLGHDDARRRMADLYQESFDQIDSTYTAVGTRGFLSDAPTGAPTFGLTVTLEPHITTVRDGATHPGYVLGYREPTGHSAQGKYVQSRMLSAAMFEVLIDAGSWATPEQHLGILNRVFAASDIRQIRSHVHDEVGTVPDGAPLNPLVGEAFELLVDGVGDEAIAARLREIAHEGLN